MFTGIVEARGKVVSLEKRGKGVQLTLSEPSIAAKTRKGGSVSLNGCCLTAVSVRRPRLSFQAVPETLRRTNLGDLKPGDTVNLELPLEAKGRFGGHMVQGHVDGLGVLRSVKRTGLGWFLTVRIPRGLVRYVVEKGSIAVDGISLTVASLKGCDAGFAIIPHTWDATNLPKRRPGDPLNVEVDMLAKHIEKLIKSYSGKAGKKR